MNEGPVLDGGAKPKVSAPDRLTSRYRTLLLYSRAPISLVYLVFGIGALAFLAAVAHAASAAWALLSTLFAMLLGAIVGLNHTRAVDRPFEAAIEAFPEATFLIDDGAISIANAAAIALVELPRDQVFGRPLTAMFASRTFTLENGDEVSWSAAIETAVLGTSEMPLVIHATGPATPGRWFEITAAHGGDSSAMGRMLVTVRDITHHRRLDEVRDEIFQLTSHDLRAPLTVITGYLDILRRPLDEPTRIRALDAARLNADSMQLLLDDLVDSSHAEELLAPKIMAPIALADLAEEVAKSIGDTDPSHRMCVIAEDRPIVLGEARRLRQALVNVVMNACRYSPEGTVITLRVSTLDNTALLAVEDEGPGIPADSREDVFARYRRLGDSSESRPGFGLGLYIVRLIAENHGGSVRVEDAPGGGARVVLELPLADPAS
jgi:signal transduction histidine kinase